MNSRTISLSILLVASTMLANPGCSEDSSTHDVSPIHCANPHLPKSNTPPHTLRCGHSFCKECLDKESWICPICKPKCVICLEEFQPKEILSTLLCGHRFHTNCINEWKINCPLCKKNRPVMISHGGQRTTSQLTIGTALRHSIRTRTIYEIPDLIKKLENPNTLLSSGLSPLLEAIKLKKPEAVKMLLSQQGIDVDQPNKDGITPLLAAAHYGYSDIVRLLIEHGANPDKPNAQGQTPLMIAAGKGDLASVKVLLVMKANVQAKSNLGNTALYFAQQSKHTAIVQELMRHGASGQTFCTLQ